MEFNLTAIKPQLIKLARNKIVRNFIFPLFSFFDFNLKITHYFTKRSFYLRAWAHKGYWFYGAQRESREVEILARHVDVGDVVLEIGGHIGFVSQIFEKLVGESGAIHVIEPTPASFEKLKMNTLSTTHLHKAAINDYDGQAILYTETNGGFTNSLSQSFINDIDQTKKMSRNRKSLTVDCMTIDSFCKKHGVNPRILKVDIEGLELNALNGAKRTLKNIDFVMIETGKYYRKVDDILKLYGFEKLPPHETCFGDKNTGGIQNHFYKKISKQ